MSISICVSFNVSTADILYPVRLLYSCVFSAASIEETICRSFSVTLAPLWPPLPPFPFPSSTLYLVIPRSVHDIHFVRIPRGGFQARKPPTSRGRRSEGKRQTRSPSVLSFSISVSCVPTCFFFFSSLSSFLRRAPSTDGKRWCRPGMRTIPWEYREPSKRTCGASNTITPTTSQLFESIFFSV